MAATVPNPSGTAEKFLRLIPGEIHWAVPTGNSEMLSIVPLFRNDDSICYAWRPDPSRDESRDGSPEAEVAHGHAGHLPAA